MRYLRHHYVDWGLLEKTQSLLLCSHWSTVWVFKKQFFLSLSSPKRKYQWPHSKKRLQRRHEYGWSHHHRCLFQTSFPEILDLTLSIRKSTLSDFTEAVTWNNTFNCMWGLSWKNDPTPTPQKNKTKQNKLGKENCAKPKF